MIPCVKGFGLVAVGLGPVSHDRPPVTDSFETHAP